MVLYKVKLVAIFIRWSSTMLSFVVVDQKYTKETKGPKVSKRVDKYMIATRSSMFPTAIERGDWLRFGLW